MRLSSNTDTLMPDVLTSYAILKQVTPTYQGARPTAILLVIDRCDNRAFHQLNGLKLVTFLIVWCLLKIPSLVSQIKVSPSPCTDTGFVDSEPMSIRFQHAVSTHRAELSSKNACQATRCSNVVISTVASTQSSRAETLVPSVVLGQYLGLRIRFMINWINCCRY